MGSEDKGSSFSLPAWPPASMPRMLVELDLLSQIDGINYENSGVNVNLTLRMANDPELGLKACTTCGETITPLWRKGPEGPKTLCNACGIRFKKEVNMVRGTLTLALNAEPEAGAGGAGNVA